MLTVKGKTVGMKKQIASAKSDYSFARKNIVRFAVRISVPVVMAALIVLTFLLYIECAPGLSDTRLPFNFGLNFCGMALLLFLAIAVSLDSTPEDSASVFFSILLSAVFVGAMTNAISIIASGNMQFFVLNKISTFICCLCSPITCFVYCCYQEALYDVKSSYFNPFPNKYRDMRNEIKRAKDFLVDEKGMDRKEVERFVKEQTGEIRVPEKGPNQIAKEEAHAWLDGMNAAIEKGTTARGTMAKDRIAMDAFLRTVDKLDMTARITK